MVIDEIQRAPDLLLAIKAQVDADPTPGRFLLTGSARVLGLRPLPDTLVGRMETAELWPFSQGEIDRTPDGFIDAVFSQGDELRHHSTVSRAEYAERLVRGGFPEAVARTNDRRRRSFFNSYLGDLIARDVQQLSEIERTTEMRAASCSARRRRFPCRHRPPHRTASPALRPQDARRTSERPVVDATGLSLDVSITEQGIPLGRYGESATQVPRIGERWAKPAQRIATTTEKSARNQPFGAQPSALAFKPSNSA